MAFPYRIIQKINPQDITAPKKQYAQAVNRGELNLRQFAREIAEISTVGVVDTIAVIESFIELLPKHLLQGETVRLGDFGSFSLMVQSEGVEQDEKPGSKMIKGVKVIFRPGKELKSAIRTVAFEKAD